MRGYTEKTSGKLQALRSDLSQKFYEHLSVLIDILMHAALTRTQPRLLVHRLTPSFTAGSADRRRIMVIVI
jgi:hypothetical protein